MAEQKAAIVIVGGVSHTPVFFEAIVKELGKRGHNATAVDLPTIGEDTENATIADEITAIRDAVSSYLDKDQDVILLLHSYGGWPGSRAIKDLDKETRVKAGKKTGIIEAVFLAGFVIPDNAPMAKWSHLPDWITVENGRRIFNDSAVPLLFSDLEPEQQKYWHSQARWQRNAFTGETIPDAPWHLSIPKRYIFTTKDKTFPAVAQMSMLAPNIDATWAFTSIESGHSPFLSHPVQLADVLLQKRY